jgi:hypothetical protein
MLQASSSSMSSTRADAVAAVRVVYGSVSVAVLPLACSPERFVQAVGFPWNSIVAGVMS